MCYSYVEVFERTFDFEREFWRHSLAYQYQYSIFWKHGPPKSFPRSRWPMFLLPRSISSRKIPFTHMLPQGKCCEFLSFTYDGAKHKFCFLLLYGRWTYIRVYVLTSIYIYTDIHARMEICLTRCMQAYIHTYIVCIYVYTHTWIGMYIHVCMDTLEYAWIHWWLEYAYMYVYLHGHMHICIHVCTLAWIHTCIMYVDLHGYIGVCMHVCILVSLSYVTICIHVCMYTYQV